MSTLPTLAPVSNLGPIITGILSSSPSRLSPPNQLKAQQKAPTAMGADCVYSCSDFVTDGCVLAYLLNSNIVSAVRLAGGRRDEEKALLFELLLLLVSGQSKSERVLAYLACAEQAEPDVWLRDDYRIAWLTVLYSANGCPTPWEWAFNQVVGGHPRKVIPQLVARAAKHVAMELPPKKAAASTRSKPALIAKEKTS